MIFSAFLKKNIFSLSCTAGGIDVRLEFQLTRSFARPDSTSTLMDEYCLMMIEVMIRFGTRSWRSVRHRQACACKHEQACAKCKAACMLSSLGLTIGLTSKFDWLNINENENSFWWKQ